MQLTISKVIELPEMLSPNTVYMTGSGEPDLLVVWVTDESGKIIKHTPLRSGLMKRGTTLIDKGIGVYTINCAIQPAVFNLPEATGSQDVRVMSFINATSLRNGAILTNGSDTLNGVLAPFVVAAPTIAVLVDSAEGKWVIDKGGDCCEDGEEGPQGARGLQGAQGCRGHRGNTGIPGTNGSRGPQGAAGAEGPIGPAGCGDEGPQGATGPQGPAGGTGLVGAQGAVGTTGAAGGQGAIGPVGPASLVPGPVGATGTQGAVGTQGTQGAQGAVGAQGVAGTQGTQGAQGADGVGSSYSHEQTTSSTTWVVNHNLNGYYNVTVVDENNAVIYPEIVYTDSNTITVTHSLAMQGRVFVS